MLYKYFIHFILYKILFINTKLILFYTKHNLKYFIHFTLYKIVFIIISFIYLIQNIIYNIKLILFY